MNHNDKLIFVGVISSAHGIKGDVLVKSFTDPAVNICGLSVIDKEGVSFKLKLIRQNSKGDLICKINDIRNRNEIEKLKGVNLFCLRSDLPESEDDDEFYIEDLKELKILNKDHEILGVIKNILNFGAGDIIEVELQDGTSQLFPFTKEIFTKITKEYVIMVPPTITS